MDMTPPRGSSGREQRAELFELERGAGIGTSILQ
jgi:hypothetical protein